MTNPDMSEADVTDRICSIEDCDNPTYAKALCSKHYQRQNRIDPNRPRCLVTACNAAQIVGGMCPTHYERLRKRGTVDDPVRAAGRCAVPDCRGVVKGRGWCSAHYARWRKTGDVREAEPLAIRSGINGGICKVADCGRRSHSGGYCSSHHQRLHRSGSVDESRPIGYRVGQGRTCSIPECGSPHNSKGLCNSHYKKMAAAKRSCAVEGCDRTYSRGGYCRGHYDRQVQFGDPTGGRPIRDRAPNGSPRPVTTQGGYVLTWFPAHANAQGNGYILEHVLIMSQHLGRPLIKGENVHHKNGVKNDNRIENLELWATSQPSGQRPDDLVEYAKAILARYGSPPF